MKTLARLALALAAVVLAFEAFAQAPRDFAWRFSLATQGEHAYYALRLPAAVYEGAVRDDLGDLRIFNGDGSAVPYAMLPLPAPARERAETFDLALFPLFVDDAARNLGDLSLKVRRDAAGTSVDVTTRDGAGVAPKRLAGYLVDAGEHSEPFAALTLRLANAANVDARVRVDGSDDLVGWRTLASSAPLLALEYRGQRLVRDRVALTGGAARYLRVTFAPSSPAVELAAVRGEFRERMADVPREWREVAGTVDREHPGDYLFDVGGSFPVDRLTLILPEVNTVAPAQIFAAARVQDRVAPQDSWRLVGTTVFYRLRDDGNETVNPPLAIAFAAARRFKVHVDPKSGGLGDQPPKLSVGWRPQSVVFAARGNGPFTLAYGNAQASSAALPIRTLVPGYESATAHPAFGAATIGEPAAPPALAALRAPIDVKRWLLWATLALATLVLAWMAARLLRQMGQPASGNADGRNATSTPERGADANG